MARNLQNLSLDKINPLSYSLTTRFKDRYFLKYLWPENTERILDIGCGIGYLLSLFNSTQSLKVGMDLSFESLRTAKNFVYGQMVCGDGQILPFKDNTFDRIIFADIIEHVFDDSSSLKEIVRVSRKNAKVVISTPALEGLITRTWLKHWLHGDKDRYQRDYRPGYTAESLGKLAESNNIHINKISYTNYYLTELLIGLLKLAFYIKKRDYNSQNDLVNIADNKVFWFYRRFIFPLFYNIGRVEEHICKNVLKGHCLILCGIVEK
ncbi:MAG: methyltransferase domain-containing protein [Thermodesulfobacteriota bacterium]|nr:methyltransferase domain-containing protein [Thermodesulfobacteriota bacterium]